MTRNNLMRSGLAAFSALALVSSCADERPARSFVQPNVIAKSDMGGTFHYLQTVTNAPPTNGAMFIGQSSSLLTIRFDIEQNYIYARRAYPQVANSEDDEVSAGPNYMGEPLAAWAITSQFDIIRDYNSTTGEQTNEIIESQERPWEEREYIRVDWSKNLITDYVGLGMDLFFSDGQPTVEGVSYWQSDPTQPDALHMEHLTADTPDGLLAGDMNYLDLTNEMIITPENLTVGDVSYPKCFFYYEQDDCASQLISVRHAFVKVGPNHQYEPRQWDGTQMNLFGVWDVGLRRLSYNTEYGITNTGSAHKAARFNLWTQSFDAKGVSIPTAQRVASGFLKKIPYYAEGSMPITYEGDPQFPDGMQDSIYPPELYPDFENIVGQWNAAMKTAVQDLSCDAANPAECPIPHDIFVPCHNPVRNTDDPVCQQGLAPLQDANGNNILDKFNQPILRARQADPRNSCVFWVDQPQAAGPLGYGPPLYDEVSGETISGQAYIYGAALQTYAARSRDLLLLMNGDISETDYVNGTNVEAWVASHPQGVGFAKPNLAVTSGNLINPTQLLAMSASMNFDWAKGLTPENGFPFVDTSSAPAIQTSLSQREQSIYNGYFQYGSNSRDAVMSSLANTPIEEMMTTPENMAASGVSPMYGWSDLNDTQKLQSSPIRSVTLQQQIDQMQRGAEIRGVDLYDGFTDNGLQQRLRAYQAQFGVGLGGALAAYAEPLRIDLIHSIFTAVTLHEMGHNMGCRHNFRASYDAMNYQPGYWDIRTAAALNPDPGTPPNPAGNPIMLHPRYVNQAGGKLTEYELNNQVQEYQYSSIMDYGSEFNSDIQGLGMYDKTLIKFSYAQYTEVFTNAKTDPASLGAFASMSQFQSALGFPSPLGAGSQLSAIAYQTLPNFFLNGKDGICSQQPPCAVGQCQGDALASHADTWCLNRMDVPYSTVREIYIGNGGSFTGDVNENPVVPYYFCSDEFVGNLTCQRFDSGADAYEQASDIISRYNNFYLYNNFKRDRAKFYTSAAYKGRVASRYFDMLRDQLTWYTLLRSDFQAQFTAEAEVGVGDPNSVIAMENQFFTDEAGWGNFTAGVSAGFDLLGQVLVTPTAGIFYRTTAASSGSPLWTAYGNDGTSFGDPLEFSPGVFGHTVGLLDGKYTNTIWDVQGCGYFWADECQERIGYLIDKEVALDVLSQSTAYFTGFDTSTDVRQYAIGYVIPFKQQLEDKIGAILASDNQGAAPYFAATGTSANGATTYGLMQPSWTLDDPNMQKGDPNDPLQGLVDPATGFTIQLYAGVYALAAFPTTFDRDFIGNSQIFVVGNGEAPVPDSELETASTAACAAATPTTPAIIATTDPSQLLAHGGTCQWLVVADTVNGQSYAAHTQPNNTLTVLNANDPTGQTTTTTNLRPDTGTRMLEQLLNFSNQYAAAQALPPTDPSAAQAVSFTQTQFLNYRENVQIMQSLINAFGYGPYTSAMQTYY